MYAMMAPVEAGNLQAYNVHFETPNLALPMIRELMEFEIDWVSGGIDYRQVLRAATVGATTGFLGGVATGATVAVLSGGSLGFAIGVGGIGGAAGGFVIGAAESIGSQLGIF